MHAHLIAAALTAAHHAPVSQHGTKYWLTGVLIALGVGLIAATVSKVRG